MKMNERQLALITEEVKRLAKLPGGFYEKKYEGIDVDKVTSQEDFEQLPFTTKADLRNAYPLGLQAVSEEEVVRIHSSSGTTGPPVSFLIQLRMLMTGQFSLLDAMRQQELPIRIESRLLLAMVFGLPESAFSLVQKSLAP